MRSGFLIVAFEWRSLSDGADQIVLIIVPTWGRKGGQKANLTKDEGQHDRLACRTRTPRLQSHPLRAEKPLTRVERPRGGPVQVMEVALRSEVVSCTSYE